MSAKAFAVFATPLGACGIAWGVAGIAGVQLPESDAAHTRRRLRRRFAEAGETEPPGFVAEALARISALLGGEPADLRDLPLELGAMPAFDAHVYERTREIPAGTVRTYGEIAALLGEPGAAREVGAALGRNPVPLIVPCHRVIAAGGRLGGFSAAGGRITKRRLLEIEGARADPGPDLFDVGAR